jgi:hypothetical protein
MAYVGRLDLARVVGKIRRRRGHDMRSLAPEVRGTQVVEGVVEPRRVNESNSPDVERSKCEHGRGAGRGDRHARPSRKP